MVFKQAVLLVVVTSVLAFGVNLISPNAIPYIGNYRSLYTGSGPIVPPEAQLGDPPFIAVDVAELDFSSGEAVFVDSREPHEYDCGTIPGAICIPFDFLPEGDLAPYFDSALGYVSRDSRIVTFCSGEECDLSLHLARNMQDVGYTNVVIFFGGSREWEKYELPVQRRIQCDE